MIKFENPIYLLLIFILIPILLFEIKNLKQFKESYSQFPNFKKLIKSIQKRKIFFLFSWIFLCLSLACPLWGSKPISVRQKGSAVMIVSDISKSMTLKDLAPSRMSIQKYFLKILIEQLDETAFGLITAKGKGIVNIPITFEKNALLSAIDSLSPQQDSSIGTNLESGISVAINSFAKNRTNSKIILLCTDGDETNGELINITKKIKKSNITLIILGIGTKEGGSISILNNEGRKEEKTSKLNETKLQKITNLCGKNSLYVNACSLGAIEKIIDKISLGEKHIEKMVYIQEPVKRNFEMLIISFMFLCLGGIFFYAKKN